ncbi:hypothetical protein C7C46_04135 [Streptomyces tateyamensis]|uniref:Integral membrane protein n=1 Tax=Streptomyces tateyamensis TaxID=565073 RepID=A0A2V4P1X4_9ACTN|nr:hypothetical protein [Streptomyces tateyamensis]PYC87514.1 hypothetical protein C7C46_04135 [Streptomyces tateyamensis]
MAQTVHRFPPLTLNTDGHRHPRENTLVAATVVLGLVAFISSFWHHMNLLSSWTGLAGIVTGGWGQFISVTTAERCVLVVSLGMAAFGFYLGMAHGGLFG